MPPFSLIEAIRGSETFFLSYMKCVKKSNKIFNFFRYGDIFLLIKNLIAFL